MSQITTTSTVAGVTKTALRSFRKPVLMRFAIDKGWAQEGDELLEEAWPRNSGFCP